MGNPYNRPITILGLAQVGVILIGIAAAGLTCKLWRMALQVANIGGLSLCPWGDHSPAAGMPPLCPFGLFCPLPGQ